MLRLNFPSGGRHAEDFFVLKIWGLRPGLNPRTWVSEARMLTTRLPKTLLYLLGTVTFVSTVKWRPVPMQWFDVTPIDLCVCAWSFVKHSVYVTATTTPPPPSPRQHQRHYTRSTHGSGRPLQKPTTKFSISVAGGWISFWYCSRPGDAHIELH
jgi:hypothetical protein